ncbi:MAG: hypothetical protein RPU34_15140 [Candidatus Sedimenticola sp. (ex Thyasira tokunagai)]
MNPPYETSQSLSLKGSHNLARLVRPFDAQLRPRMIKTRLGLKRKCDFRAQRMLKFPHRGEFHCLAEYLNAGLLEGKSAVTYYVPQPFKFRLSGILRKEVGYTYTPDIYFVEDGVRYVGELKPRAKFSVIATQALTAFFKKHRIQFVVISNESILEREVEAQNWLTIVRNCLSLAYLITDTAEWDVLDQLHSQTALPFGEFINVGRRQATETTEAAIYRLLHRGEISADLTTDFWSYETELRLCG